MSKKNGGKKVSGEKRRKQNWMWLEQVYLKLDAQEKRMDLLENRIKALESCESLGILKEHMKNHIAALSKSLEKE